MINLKIELTYHITQQEYKEYLEWKERWEHERKEEMAIDSRFTLWWLEQIKVPKITKIDVEKEVKTGQN